MADTIVEFIATPGLTLTCDLFPRGSDAAGATAKAATERTNNSGVYRVTVAEALTGWYRLEVLNGAVTIAVYDVLMADDTADHYAHDRPHEALHPVVAGRSLAVDASSRAEGNVKAVDDSTNAATRLKQGAELNLPLTVDDTIFAPTTTEFETSTGPAPADVLIDAVIVVYSGTTQFERARVVDYALVSSRGHFTVTEMTAALADGDQILVV